MLMSVLETLVKETKVFQYLMRMKIFISMNTQKLFNASLFK